MYFITHLYFHIGFTDVKELSEDDQDRSKHVPVLMDYVWKYNFNVSEHVGYITLILQMFWTSLSNAWYFLQSGFTAHLAPKRTGHRPQSLYRGADKSLARPTSRCILFDG